MTYDAIRVPWRIAVDGVWNDDARARTYLDTILPRIMKKDGASNVRMYDLQGNTIEWHNELAVAMWAAGSMGSSNSVGEREQLSSELKKFYKLLVVNR